MDEGVYTLQIKCRLPVTDLFLRCPPCSALPTLATEAGATRPDMRYDCTCFRQARPSVLGAASHCTPTEQPQMTDSHLETALLQ